MLQVEYSETVGAGSSGVSAFLECDFYLIDGEGHPAVIQWVSGVDLANCSSCFRVLSV